jgi:putative hydrolase of HD superfamily
MQAFEYEKRDNSPGHLQEFFNSTQEKIKDPFLGDIVKEINSQREALFKVREDGNQCTDI